MDLGVLSGKSNFRAKRLFEILCFQGNSGDIFRTASTDDRRTKEDFFSHNICLPIISTNAKI